MSQAQIARGDERLRRIEVTEERRAVFFVLSPLLEEAKELAAELAADMDYSDWDEIEFDLDATPAITEPSETDLVWAGGPAGEFTRWSRS